MPEERKLVTIIFADIVGSTGLAVSRDPEIVRATMRRTYDELRKILVAHEGTVEKFIGDAVMAVFGVPTTHDDDADRAVRAAFAMRERVRELSSARNAVPLELRIGINSGEVVAGTGEGGEFLVTGAPVNAAARLQQSAAPGEIVVGGLTYRLTRGGVEYAASRSIEAKGIGNLEAWPAGSLGSAVPEQRRGVEGLRAPLIGRDEELRLLLGAYERLRAEARPYLVTVFGAAGAGKSRLTDELIARLDTARVRQGRCLPYGEAITLWPIQLILRADAGIAPSDDLAAARERLRDAVRAAFPTDPEDADAIERRLAVLAGLAAADETVPDIPAAELADELAWGLRRYLERRAGSEPLLLVFEDIHWAAPALLALIEHLAEWAKAPLFLLCLARPEFLDARPGWGGGKVNATSIVLEPLTVEETRELVAKLLDIDALTEDVRSAVIERAEGNPLYVEEFIRLLIETGQIAQRAGRWVAMPLGELRVPPTLQGLIAARLDTAPPEVKQLLQRAAVIGRFFPTTGLAALNDGRPPDVSQLRDAVRRDLIVDSDERGVGGGRLYRFKHVLIREVAYAAVPKTERATLHDRYVRWYEDALGDRREDFIDLIAHHAEQAYLFATEMGLPEAPALARRAYERIHSAADRARSRTDWAAALALYRRALAASAAGDGTAQERIEASGYVVLMRHYVEATAEALADVDRAVAEARSAGLPRLEFDLIDGSLWQHLDKDARSASVTRLNELAGELADPDLVVRALWWRTILTTTLAEDRALFTEALGIAELHKLEARIVDLLANLIRIDWTAARFTAAREATDALRIRLGTSPTRQAKLDLLWLEEWQALETDDFAAAATLFEESLALSRESDSPRLIAGGLGNLGMCCRLAGDLQRARALQEERLAVLKGKVAPQHVHAEAELSRVLLALGDVAGARQHVEVATEILGERGEWRSSVLFARAFVHAAEGEDATADALFADAFAIVDTAGYVWPRARRDHARYLIDHGRIDEARAVLTALRTKLTDPLADRLRAATDGLLAECATPAR